MWVETSTWYALLPPMVPTHFDIAGRPNQYGSKAFLWLLPLIATLFFASLSFLRRIDPRLYNYPVEIARQSKREAFAAAKTLVAFLNLVVVAVFVCLELAAVRVATGHYSGLFTTAIWFITAAGIAAAFAYIIKLYRDNAKP